MHTQKGIAPIVLIIIAAILLGGGYVAYRNYQPAQLHQGEVQSGRQPTTDSADAQKASGATNQEGKTETSVDTSDWKTYRNEKYGFEFKYPPNWFSKDSLYPYNEFAGSNQFLICLNPENVGPGDCYSTLSVNWPVSIQQWYDRFKKLYKDEKGVSSVEESEIYVSGTKAKLLSAKSDKGLGYSAYWEYDNHVYDFKMNVGNEDMFFNILSTFKFTK